MSNNAKFRLFMVAVAFILGLIILAPLRAMSAEFKEEVVFDFSGGMVNSIENNKMNKNMALVFKDFDLFEFGGIKRRAGMSVYYVDAYDGYPIEQIFPYKGPYGSNNLLTTRILSDYFTDDTAINNINIVTMCVDSGTPNCTTLIYDGFYYRSRDYNYPFNLSATSSNKKLIIASTKSEPIIFNGDIAWPMRPYGPGQLRAVALDGGGNVDGSFRYKYCYLDKDAPDSSNFSSPSKEIDVTNGKVFLWNLKLSNDAGIDSILIYREENGDGHYEYIDKIAHTAGAQYMDTTTETNDADTTKYIWGPKPRLNYFNDVTIAFGPPGGLTISVDYAATTADYGIAIDTGLWLITDTLQTLGYTTAFIDSTGYVSLRAPITAINHVWAGDSTYYADLTNIPVSSNEYVEKKILLRLVDPGALTSNNERRSQFYIIDTLDDTTTTYTDSLPMRDYHIASRNYCGDTLLVMPESTCYESDSILPFFPSMVEFHGRRLFAIGNQSYPNKLYYSQFGHPEVWHNDKTISFSSKGGDWLTTIHSLGDELILFRQNSIFGLMGLSFFQFRTYEIANNVGLASPATLDGDNNQLYFFYKAGVYALGQGGGVSKDPVSLPIQNSIDSIGNPLTAVGKVINGEYWFSASIDDTTVNNKTYVFSQHPIPHWKSYSFGIKDAAMYDYNSNVYDYSVGKWILLINNDSLYGWNYSADDTLDGNDTIIAVYQSKYFFDDQAREKILYIDIVGTGICDSLLLTFYGDYGQDTLNSVVKSIDFTSGERQRVKVDHTTNNFSVKIQDYGMGDYVIKGYTIGYIDDIDEGRKR